jgi:hypothetical protein
MRTGIQIRIQLLILVTWICYHWSMDPPWLNFEPFHLLKIQPIMGIWIQLFTLMRIRIQLPNIMRIRIRRWLSPSKTSIISQQHLNVKLSISIKLFYYQVRKQTRQVTITKKLYVQCVDVPTEATRSKANGVQKTALLFRNKRKEWYSGSRSYVSGYSESGSTTLRRRKMRMMLFSLCRWPAGINVPTKWGEILP